MRIESRIIKHSHVIIDYNIRVVRKLKGSLLDFFFADPSFFKVVPNSSAALLPLRGWLGEHRIKKEGNVNT